MPEVADILEKYWHKKHLLPVNTWQLRTLDAIRRCRTAALGGHVHACDCCGNISISYNSCRNRHCPKCQGHKKEEWIKAREAELLPVPYFHVVFTLPSELNLLAMHEPAAVYDALFAASWATLAAFGKENKAGMIAVLHTWGQNLSLHPHIHCIVPGIVISKNGNWHLSKNAGKFLYPVKALSKFFKGKYIAILREKLAEKFPQSIRNLIYKKDWIVYAKRPFGNAKSVVEYLGRYTHKIAISNSRIQSIDNDTVTFGYKDYKTGAQKKSMTLSHAEFIRRFSQHILPKRFVRIRHHGILSSTWKREKLPSLQEKLWLKPPPPKPAKGAKIRPCPCCKTGHLHTILAFDTRGSPQGYEHLWAQLVAKAN